MHVVFRESHGLEETATPTDLGQDPAELVVLSFSDSDLGAFAAGWHRGGGAQGLPSLRLANLAALRLPDDQRLYPRWISVLGLASCLFLAFWVPVDIWVLGLGLIGAGLVFKTFAPRLWKQPI